MSKRRHRPLLIVFVAVLAVAFVALGWWQYNRFEGAGGNARNLGYAMQWPLFAVAAVWGYKRFIELEEEADLLRERQIVLERVARLGVHCLDLPAKLISTAVLNRYLMIKQRGLL